MVYDPCNVVPDNNIPTGLVAHRHHVGHHVVGRIKHTIHHKFPILGPSHPAPTPFGCEKHAILPARPTGNGIAGPGAAAPSAKFAALGGAGAGLVALGGLGGLVGGIIPGISNTTKTKTTITPPGTTPVSTNPAPLTTVPPTAPNPPTVVVPPTNPTIPGIPPVTVPEPSTLAVFLVAVAVALAARHFHRRQAFRAAASSG